MINLFHMWLISLFSAWFICHFYKWVIYYIHGSVSFFHMIHLFVFRVIHAWFLQMSHLFCTWVIYFNTWLIYLIRAWFICRFHKWFTYCIHESFTLFKSFISYMIHSYMIPPDVKLANDSFIPQKWFISHMIHLFLYLIHLFSTLFILFSNMICFSHDLCMICLHESYFCTWIIVDFSDFLSHIFVCFTGDREVYDSSIWLAQLCPGLSFENVLDTLLSLAVTQVTFLALQLYKGNVAWRYSRVVHNRTSNQRTFLNIDVGNKAKSSSGLCCSVLLWQWSMWSDRKDQWTSEADEPQSITAGSLALSFTKAGGFRGIHGDAGQVRDGRGNYEMVL